MMQGKGISNGECETGDTREARLCHHFLNINGRLGHSAETVDSVCEPDWCIIGFKKSPTCC